MNHSALTTRNLGLAIFALLSFGDIATLALTDGESPPYAVAALAALLGAASLALVVQGYRDPARSLRLLIGLRVLAAVTALPAFFVDAPGGAQAAAGAIVVLTAAAVLLTARASQPAVA
ncbi:hypothetical protein GA707_15780 [Nostocoides sp. F2B08]|uniref:hypothetical protein n=1 Tax=Nostocoides sp. F2B08 TaxID=2653936 RepID=UPI001262FA4F|nr:hypothetical protein [Tetrasphaera sp. F2B08]KAB7743096.1 hypothetical protein GA707_15780 [Tetrasphaera sp. F2B08]